MKHIDENMIFQILNTIENRGSLNENEVAAVKHIKNCQECYDKFCSSYMVAKVTGDEGFEFIKQICTEQQKQNSKERQNIYTFQIGIEKYESDFAVTYAEQIDLHDGKLKFKDNSESVSDTVFGQSSFRYRTNRQASVSECKLKKIVNIYNESTYISIDAVSDELIIQIDKNDLELENVDVYVMYGKKHSIREVTMEDTGNYMVGRLNCIPKENFKLYIEEVE